MHIVDNMICFSAPCVSPYKCDDFFLPGRCVLPSTCVYTTIINSTMIPTPHGSMRNITKLHSRCFPGDAECVTDNDECGTGLKCDAEKKICLIDTLGDFGIKSMRNYAFSQKAATPFWRLAESERKNNVTL